MEQQNDVARSFLEAYIIQSGFEQCLRDKMVISCIHTFELFHYCLDGEGFVEYGERKYRVTKGMIFFIPSGYSAKYYPNPENPWTYAWVGFAGTNIQAILKEVGIDLEHPIYVDRDNNCKNYFTEIHTTYARKGNYDLYCVGKLLELFSVILDVNHKQRTKAETIVKLAEMFIRNNYQFDVKISDVARNVNVSPNYLSNLFQQTNNISTKTYLTKVRMENARIFMQNPQYSIKEIAAMVGYKDQLHFSKEFKNYYGVAPSVFRTGAGAETKARK